MGLISLTCCFAARCSVDVVVVVVCAFFRLLSGAWFAIGVSQGKCLWLIAHCGLVVLWCDQGGRDAGLMRGLQSHSCAVLSSGAVSCWGRNDYGQVIAVACSRGGLGVCMRGHCAADEVLSAGW